MEIVVDSLHTEDMIKSETKQMLFGADSGLTLGMLMTLALEHSPYIYGGALDEGAIQYAYELSDKHLPMPEFHTALMADLEAAWRAFEIIAPDTDLHPRGKTSKVEMCSPEWLADTIGNACQSMPSLGYRQVLWEVPLAMVTHLAMATARRNGTITERPADIKRALELLKTMKEKEQSNNG